MPTFVTVVVATYRRPQLLDRCLQALLTQDFPPSAYEIIIVDDGPEDPATRELIIEWQQRLQTSFQLLAPPVIEQIPVSGGQGLPVTQVSQELVARPQVQTRRRVKPRAPVYPRLYYLPAPDTHGPAAARNLGWRAAEGEIIAFTDDDTIPDPHWLANGVSAFIGDVAAVSGRVIVPLPPDPTDNDRNTTGLERSDFVTANCFYRRQVLESVGVFDERFKTAWREDSDLYFTLRERGYPLAWASNAVVLHPVRPEAWGSSLRTQKKSFYNALLYKKHPALYRKFIQPAPPWSYYGMLLALYAGLVSLLLGHWVITGLTLVVWAALETRFILQRLNGTSHRPEHVKEMIITSLAIPALSVYWRLRGAIRWKVWFL